MENSKHTVQLLFLSLSALLLLMPANCRADTGSGRFVAIAYHDVVDTREELASDAVTTDHLIDQFEWLLANNYHPVSVSDLILANRGEKKLPEKPVLLCWDDGYTSFYEKVFPLLRAYNYPAVLAIVGTWLEPEPNANVLYGDNLVPRKKFLTWQQLSKLDQSGLVEIASHSYNLHRAVLADKAGDRLPAVITHIYNKNTGQYENDAAHKNRILTDLQKNNALLTKHLGHPPRVMVWPFGQYNSAALEAAEMAGMPVTLTLDPIPGNIANLQEIGRIYPTLNPELPEFREFLNLNLPHPIRHFFKVDSADILDTAGSEVHFGAFLDRLVDIKPDMVVFEPTVTIKNSHYSLFQNSRYPLAQDRLTRLTWHTSKRGSTGTFLWLSAAMFSPADTSKTDSAGEFFKQLGTFAFSEGLLIDYPRLNDALMKAAASSDPYDNFVKSWDPSLRRLARKNAVHAADTPIISSAFMKLESFQYWQPFVELGLVVSTDLLPQLDAKTTKYLLKYFDFLLLDTRKSSSNPQHTLTTCLPTLEESGLLPQMSILLQYDGTDKQLRDQLTMLPSRNIINWGYEYDNFQECQPSAGIIRTFLSKTSYPFR